MANNINPLITQLLACTTAGEAKPVVDELVRQLCEITALDLHPALFLDEHATITPQGKAVSPTTAAQCAEDVQRTRVFMQAVYAAIQQKLQHKDSQGISLLYAGTGPFGLLLIPLLPLLDAARVRVTLLDIHAESLAKLQQVIDYLGVSHFVAHSEQTDACTWQTDQRYDLIISETMRQGLIQEPQVSIFSHLQQFLKDDGWLLPEIIRLDLWLSSGGSPALGASGPPDVHLGRVLQLDKASAIQIGRGDMSCAQGSLWVPDYASRLKHLKLTTFIQVFGDYQLHENQSQLTLPLFERNARVQPNSLLRFHYELGAYPQCVFAYEKMPALTVHSLPDSLEKNVQGIYHLPRLWHKVQLRKQAGTSSDIAQQLADIPASEWLLDRILFDQLGAGLEPALQKCYAAHELAEFEHWLANETVGDMTPEKIQRANQAILHFINNGTSGLDDSLALPLDAQQLAHWDEQGYLVVPGVLSPEETAAVRAAICEELQIREDDPATWYRPAMPMQKIMVQLFTHPALEVARKSDYIRRIFQQLWQRNDVVMATDRVSFNPPETATWQFPGPAMHWDVDLVAPIPFGTQALIYVTDVAENQGAFSCVPGFHKQIDEWLAQQPRGVDPQQQDWSQWSIKPIAAKAGDLIVWHHALPHGSSPNRAQLPRMVQYLNMYR
ncbi:phytanoyl-CoA dioxygenase family protein [Cellvibrio sp. PSBB023]|uniref:phytanoyl-CoA dioxygenase family protein n=1 Tax=Cellvibrio sp. PSBB023 TaxID=1945512 RepID=UPI0009900EB5|nr:phytanoyl-CoA dioxygenase family protein [Cellvibrio sp. PSBB023]AQT61719.1 phytanoyl-CoA dioxygenase [Cellvibrio sp. PSBB023]